MNKSIYIYCLAIGFFFGISRQMSCPNVSGYTVSFKFKDFKRCFRSVCNNKHVFKLYLKFVYDLKCIHIFGNPFVSSGKQPDFPVVSS